MPGSSNGSKRPGSSGGSSRPSSSSGSSRPGSSSGSSRPGRGSGSNGWEAVVLVATTSGEGRAAINNSMSGEGYVATT